MKETAMRIGFIGFGEVGYFTAKGLAEEGVEGIVAYDAALEKEGDYRATVLSRAERAGVTLVSLADLAASADVIFCAVQAQYAPDVAAKALPFIRPGTMYADLTTAKPLQKQAAAAKFSEKGLAFVDGAIMGSLIIDAHKVPMLCSGEGAETLRETMNKHGMRMTYVPGKAGAASTLKLVRSSFTKGAEALAVETMLFARKMGVEDETMRSLAEFYGRMPFDAMLSHYIRGNVIHAGRRAHEARDCAELMEDIGIDPVMARATAERLQSMADLNLKEKLGGVTPSADAEVYALWEKTKYR